MTVTVIMGNSQSQHFHRLKHGQHRSKQSLGGSSGSSHLTNESSSSQQTVKAQKTSFDVNGQDQSAQEGARQTEGGRDEPVQGPNAVSAVGSSSILGLASLSASALFLRCDQRSVYQVSPFLFVSSAVIHNNYATACYCPVPGMNTFTRFRQDEC